MAEARRGCGEPPDRGDRAAAPRGTVSDPIAGDTASPDAGQAARLVEPLQDRLRVVRAQDLLAGLAGCSPGRAARALRDTAAALDLDATHLAERFLRSTDIPDAEHAALVDRLIETVRRHGRDTEGPPADASAGGQPRADRYRRLPQPLQVAPIAAGATPGVAVRGELDLEAAARLLTDVMELWRAARADRRADEAFVLDLSEVTFLDVAGLDALTGVYAGMVGRGCRVRVTPPATGGPRRLLLLAASRGWIAVAFDPDGADPASTDWA